MEILYLPQSTFWESKKVLNVTFLHDANHTNFYSISYNTPEKPCIIVLLKLDSNNNVSRYVTNSYFNFCHLYKYVSFCLMRAESL